MKKQAEKESYLDQLKQQESDETWKKRTNQWQKEEEARNKLAKEVYDERNRQLQMKCIATFIVVLINFSTRTTKTESRNTEGKGTAARRTKKNLTTG